MCLQCPARLWKVMTPNLFDHLKLYGAKLLTRSFKISILMKLKKISRSKYVGYIKHPERYNIYISNPQP